MIIYSIKHFAKTKKKKFFLRKNIEKSLKTHYYSGEFSNFTSLLIVATINRLVKLKIFF